MKESKKIRKDIPKEIADKKIIDLGLSDFLKKQLKFHGISTIGELLSIDYKDLESPRYYRLKEQALQDLKNFVHDLGYTFPNEEITVTEMREYAKILGANLLEDSGISIKMCNILYRAGIFTLEEIKTYTTEELLNVYQLGPIQLNILMEKLKEFGIDISENTEPLERDKTPTLEDLVEILKVKPNVDRELEKLKILKKRYYSLAEELEDLKLKMKEIDHSMNNVQEEIKDIQIRVRKNKN